MASTSQGTGAGYGKDRIDLRNEAVDSVESASHSQPADQSGTPALPAIASTVSTPTQGIRSVLWKVARPVYVRTGWEGLRLEASLEEQEAAARDRLWRLGSRQLTIAVTSQKGGSAKTATACWESALIKQVLMTSVLVLDLNESGGGGAAVRLGLNPAQTLRTSQLMQGFKQLTHNHATLIQGITLHRQTGVGVIASDDVVSQQYSLADFQTMLAEVKGEVHTLWCDTGNGLLSASNLSAVDLADVLVLSGREEQKSFRGKRRSAASGKEEIHDSLRSIRFTMEKYHEVGFKEKVRNAQIVIFGAAPKTWKRYAQLFGVDESQIHLVPYNSYMAEDRPVDLQKIPPAVRVALLQLAVSIYETPTSHDQVDVQAQLDALATADYPPLR